jgi:protein-tyrosine phosphatase
VERGIDISSHRATQVTRDMCMRADLVLTMDNGQRKQIEDRYPQACGRVFRVGEHIKQDIPDPFRQSERVFRISLALLESSVREWLQRIEKLARVRL